MRGRWTVAAAGVLLAAGLAAAAEKPRDYRGELRQIQSNQRRKRYAECVAACEKMLAHFKETWQIQEVTWLKIESLISDSQYETALAALGEMAKAFAGDAKLHAAAALRTGDVQRMLKKFDQAVATYRAAAKRFAADRPGEAADALHRAGDVLCDDLKKPDEAIALYEQVASQFASREPKRAAEAVRAVATTHERHTKDKAKAAAAYRRLTEQHAAAYDERTLSGFYGKAIDGLLAAEKPADALAVARKAAGAVEADALKADFALRVGDVLAAMKKLPDARRAYRGVLCAHPLDAKSCQVAQGRIVETYRAESKWADALAAARVLYDAAGSERDIRAAAEVVARAFLAADGNLARANGFLSYQRHGPAGADGKAGTDDDVAVNHLARIKYPAIGSAADERFRSAVEAQPDGYAGYRARGMLYVYWGKPKEAARELLRAFKAASLKDVPTASQELVLIGMKAHRASFHELGRIFEYLSYGPRGKTGKETIADPFAGL